MPSLNTTLRRECAAPRAVRWCRSVGARGWREQWQRAHLQLLHPELLQVARLQTLDLVSQKLHACVPS
jgi:hypothetical protein